MKRTALHIIAVLLCTACSLVATDVRADMVVVVHPDNPVTSFSKKELVDIYMGRQMNFPTGNFALPFDLPPDARVRKNFYELLVGKSVAQVNAYWARLLFTGRATPPRVLPTAATIIKMVAENSAAIAYIDSKDLTDQVKVIFQLQ